MEDNAKVVESLLEKATEFGKTNLELLKLKAVDKASDVLSTYLPLAVVFILFAIFLVFFNLGLAFWLGDVTGNIYYGFFIVAGFYGFIGLIVRIFMYKWLKRVVGNMIIKLLLR